MSLTHDPSIEELRTRSELHRATLAANVTELRGRIARVTSPANIKAEVRTYVRNERESLVDNIRVGAGRGATELRWALISRDGPRGAASPP